MSWPAPEEGGGTHVTLRAAWAGGSWSLGLGMAVDLESTPQLKPATLLGSWGQATEEWQCGPVSQLAMLPAASSSACPSMGIPDGMVERYSRLCCPQPLPRHSPS